MKQQKSPLLNLDCWVHVHVMKWEVCLNFSCLLSKYDGSLKEKHFWNWVPSLSFFMECHFSLKEWQTNWFFRLGYLADFLKNKWACLSKKTTNTTCCHFKILTFQTKIRILENVFLSLSFTYSQYPDFLMRSVVIITNVIFLIIKIYVTHNFPNEISSWCHNGCHTWLKDS